MKSSATDERRSISLALLPGKGLVRMCHTGCVHVTFNHVTLDLCRGQFEPFAALVQNLEPQRDRVLLEYGHALLRFTGEQFAEFRGMVAAAREEYQRLEVVRRLLA